MVTVNESWIDYFIIAVYFVFVLGIGAVLRTKMQTSEDYFLSGRSLPSWITGLAFLGANLGALEIMGMGAGAAQYGIMQSHYYWIGAIPAMVFVALFMIPFYYASRVHSVPGFLKLRYNEATRGFSSILFAIFMILLSGINMYAMALVFELLLGWSLTASIILSAAVVLGYVVLGGLSSSIYNEVLQFFLITLGLVPLVIFGLIDVGGLAGLKESIGDPQFFHAWANTGSTDNPSHRGVPEALVRDTRHLPRADRLVHTGPEDPNGGRGQQCRPLRDGLLLPHRDARVWPDGAARGLHERDGRQHYGFQYRLDLRPLQTVHQPGRRRPPLSQCGPHRHCCWGAPEHRNGLPGSQLYYHHELRPGAAWHVPGTALRDVPPWHVLEAHDGLGWVHRARCRNGLRPHRVPHLAGRRPGSVHGARIDRVDRDPRRNDRGLSGHPTQA